jgi:hypothetical protein
MIAEWKNLETSILAVKLAAASLRERSSELSAAEIDRLLPPVRGCLVELIALRSSLEKAKSERAGQEETP